MLKSNYLREGIRARYNVDGMSNNNQRDIGYE